MQGYRALFLRPCNEEEAEANAATEEHFTFERKPNEDDNLEGQNQYHA